MDTTYVEIFSLRVPLVLLVVVAVFIAFMVFAEYVVRANERREKAEDIARKQAGLTAVPLLLSLFDRIDRKEDALLDEDELNSALRQPSQVISAEEREAIRYLLDNLRHIGHVTERAVTRGTHVVATPYGGTAVSTRLVTNHYGVNEGELIAYLDRSKRELGAV